MADMGLGRLGDQRLVFKRKFRWTFEVQKVCGGRTIPKFFVKLASRPNLTIEETEINFLHAKTWIPGKASWETITVTYYDISTTDLGPLWDWLATVYDFTDPQGLKMGSNRESYAAQGILLMYDGCGKEMEQWTLNDMWPQAANFGELDYSSSEEATIELTLRYSQVKYEPKNGCSPAPNPCCKGC